MEAILGQVPLWGGRTTQATGAWGCFCMWQEQGEGWPTVCSLKGQQKGHHQGQRQQPETQLSPLSIIPGGTVMFPSSRSSTLAGPGAVMALSSLLVHSQPTLNRGSLTQPAAGVGWVGRAEVVPARSWTNP